MSEHSTMERMEEPAERKLARRRWMLLLPLLLFALLAAVFYKMLFSGNASIIPSVLIGKPVPDFTAPPLQGLTGEDGSPVPGFSSAQLKEGTMKLVNVWASWCVPCRQEHPMLDALNKEGVTVLGLNYKDKPQNALQFLNTLGNPFRAVGTDEAGRIAIDFGVYGVPETFVIGGDGTIRYKHVGPLTPDNIARLRAAMAAAQ